jgi:biopolymer transport protein TolR
MLVLLIVFMVAAPLLLSGLPVDLPAAKGQSLSQNKELITVTLDREGRLYLQSQEEPLEIPALIAKLKAAVKNAEEDPILFRGDRDVSYGRVSQVINAVREGGFKKFTFVSGPEDIAKGPSKR